MNLEVNDIRKQRDFAVSEKNSLVIAHAKEIEAERNQKRLALSENEKLKFKVKNLEDDLQKYGLKMERKIQEIVSIDNEKSSLA